MNVRICAVKSSHAVSLSAATFFVSLLPAGTVIVWAPAAA